MDMEFEIDYEEGGKKFNFARSDCTRDVDNQNGPLDVCLC